MWWGYYPQKDCKTRKIVGTFQWGHFTGPNKEKAYLGLGVRLRIRVRIRFRFSVRGLGLGLRVIVMG